MEIGLSTIVWIALILLLVKFWRNIFNAIGGLIYLGIVVLIGIFLVTNFTTLNIDKYVDISFYDELRRGDDEFLVEHKDNAFENALKAKDGINSIGTEEDVFKDKEDLDKVSSYVTTIEDSQINFNDESKGNEGSKEGVKEDTKEEDKVNDEDGVEGKKEVKEETKSDEGLISYSDIDNYLETTGKGMSEDTKNLVRNLSPYVSWKYNDGEYEIESTKDGVKISK